MRIGNRSRLFWTQGKSIFNKKTSSTDDSVKTEEKEALLSETGLNNDGENSRMEEKIWSTEVMELGKKISPYLTNLRKVIEEGKLFPNSRSWVDSALPILGNCIEIASQNKRKDLEQLFLDIARIIYSSDRVGKSYLSIDPSLELYSLLCCVIADFMRGQPNRPMFEQWTKTYQKVVTDFSNLGIRLVNDDEEPIATSTSECDGNYSTSETKVSSHSISKIPSQDILPSTEDISPQIVEQVNIEISPSENRTKESEHNEQIPETDGISVVSNVLKNENSSCSIEASLSEISEEEKVVFPTKELSAGDVPIETCSQISYYEENKTCGETVSPISGEVQTPEIDISSLLRQINQIAQGEVREILIDTLKAIADGIPETAKAKAIELAKEMAKLEVEKVKTDYRSAEYQIESLGSEIHQVEEQLNICQKEIKTIQNELREQQLLTQKTEKDKKDLENSIETTQNKIMDIEKRILELQQQKEIEIFNLNQQKESLAITEKAIEDLYQAISSLKESIQDFENQSMTLLQRMELLEKTKSEKENMLNQLQRQIKERESTVRRLEETLRVLQTSDGASTVNNKFTLNNSDVENTIDLFNEEI